MDRFHYPCTPGRKLVHMYILLEQVHEVDMIVSQVAHWLTWDVGPAHETVKGRRLSMCCCAHHAVSSGGLV